MRRFACVTLSAVLAVGILAVPVGMLPGRGPGPITPVQDTIALTGVSPTALEDPAALGPIQTPLAAIPDGGKLAVLTDRLDTHNFLVTGVTWDGSDHTVVTEVSARIREAGTWSPWTQLEVSDEFDQALQHGGTVRSGTEPLTTTGADGIQVRMFSRGGTVPTGARIEVIDPLFNPNDAQVADGGGAVANAAPATDVLKPRVITRDQWGANVKLGASWNTISNGIKSIYVHHTAGANNYTRAQAPGLVRGIFSYHTKGMGWPDIGYQFLTDKFGNIYQGRRSATFDTPVGAQTGGYNTGTIGVSAMGNYQTAKPTPELLEALTEVIAWKAYAYGIDPLGKTKLTTGNTSVGSTWAKPGATVTVNVIQGHRDTNATACPGINLYAKLPDLRRAVADRMAGAEIAYGTYVDSLALPVRVAPTSSQSPVQWSSRSTYRWKAVAGASSYQILTQTSGSHRSGRPANSSWTLAATTTKLSAKISVPAQVTRVIGVRAVDSAGRRGPITVLGTVSGPLKRGTLKYSKRTWKKKKGLAYFGASALRARKSGASIRVTKVGATKYVVLRARKAPGDGKVRVSLGRWSTTVSLASSKKTNDAIIKLSLPSEQSGTLTIKTTSRAQVYLTGVGLGRAGRQTVPARAQGPVAPPVTLNDPTASPLAATQSLTWKASPTADSYVVLTRGATAAGTGVGPWQRQIVSARSLSLALQAGDYREVAVLAKRGNTWGPAAGVNKFGRTLDLASAGIATGWAFNPADPLGASLTAQSNGAAATFPLVNAVTGARVVAATGPGQGTLELRAGTALLASINLATLPAAANGVVELPFAAPVSAKVQVGTVGTAPVTIRGLALTRG